MYVYTVEEKLVGMSFLFLYQDMAYLSYICVDPAFRHLGYGSEILKSISENYKNYRIALDIEEVREGSKNDQERISRKNFYLHNGYHSAGIFYYIYHVDYEILVTHGDITKEEWHSIIRCHWGPFADNAIYR